MKTSKCSICKNIFNSEMDYNRTDFYYNDICHNCQEMTLVISEKGESKWIEDSNFKQASPDTKNTKEIWVYKPKENSHI